MAGRKDVEEMVTLCTGLGLRVAIESNSGHYKVRDPQTNVYLFGISSTPSDRNFKQQIRRHLRRLGYLTRQGAIKPGAALGIMGHRAQGARKKHGIIDLEALAKAQAVAEAAGERIPTLDDLEESTEFFKRVKTGVSVGGFIKEAEEEAINVMAAKADSGRAHYTIQRLQKFMEKHRSELQKAANERKVAMGQRPQGERGELAEFVRIAMEVGEKRGLQTWKTNASGEQSLMNINKGNQKGLTIWVANLLEATMDTIEGLQFDVSGDAEGFGEYVSERKSIPKAEEEKVFKSEDEKKAEETAARRAAGLEKARKALADKRARERAEAAAKPPVATEVKPEPIEPLAEANGHVDIKGRYAEILFDILAKSDPNSLPEDVLKRLDAMAGISV